MKNRSLPLSIALLALSGAAVAADLPGKRAPLAPAPEPAATWNGFYFGLNAGAAFGNETGISTDSSVAQRGANINTGSVVAAAAAGTTRISADSLSFIGGGQIGYNHEVYERVLLGFEADIAGLSGGRGRGAASTAVLTGSGGNYWSSTTQTARRLDYLGTARGRLGYLVTPDLLAYATGGLAYGGVSLDTSIAWAGVRNGGGTFVSPSAFASAGSLSDLRVGWTVGGGVEYALWKNWSAKVEYLYYDLGRVTDHFSTVRTRNSGALAFALGHRSSTRLDGHVVRIGLNYRLDLDPAPIVAKY